MSDVAIRVTNLGKRFHLGSRAPYLRFSEVPRRLFSTLAGRLRGASPKAGAADLWALKDVSFEVQRGEVVGIIGRNGAGKSTLLKILSRITKPTEGEARIRGRVGSLLEVGTGFHPELTGRENIYLNGTILGMRKSEIDRKFDEIVAFSEIERSLDTPVKHYSSGMYMRLAFAVAAHLEPEILVVDEVLAVGDVEFQRKCLGKLGDVAAEQRTVIFVSHNMPALKKLCKRAILLTEGKVTAEGDASTIADLYLQSGYNGVSTRIDIAPRRDLVAAITSIAVTPAKDPRRAHLYAGEAWIAHVQIDVRGPLPHCIVALGIMSSDGQPIHTFWSTPADLPIGYHTMVFRYNQIQLGAGCYRLAVGLSSYERTIHYIENAGGMRIEELPSEGVKSLRTAGCGYLLNEVDTELRLHA